jgi:hypothetical protein
MSGVGIPAWFCGIDSIVAGVLFVFWGPRQAECA